jgi:uncharacterized protein YjeT (DUF2065 family)
MLPEFLTAMALLLVIEGIMPFLSPNGYRKMMAHISKNTDKALRIMGLCMMLFGLVIMLLIHHMFLFG